MLTDDQEKALSEIKAFILNDTETTHTLRGYAGSGKSFLTKHIFEFCHSKRISVAGVCPTHKARKVLEKILNKDSLIQVTTMTVAAFLSKLRGHSYVGTKNYQSKGQSKAKQFDLFIIDECSMIADKDVLEIVEHIASNNKKALFIGDNAQIPNPVQTFTRNEDGSISKKDSLAFDFPTSSLTTIVRQDNDNPLLDIYTEIRKNLFREPKITRENNIVNGKGIRFYDNGEMFLAKIKRDLLKIQDVETRLLYKVITYTNESVRFYNKFIRDCLEYKDKFVLGDILMGYNTVGYPIPYIENGQEYIITSIQNLDNHLIRYYKEQFYCKGTLITAKIVDGDMTTTLFFPDILDNKEIFTLLKDLAKNVNRRGSTKEDFKKYSAIKNQLCFMENIFDLQGTILSESELREKHPKLFNLVSYYIDNVGGKLVIKKSKAVEKINAIYPGLLEFRISDNKPPSDSERLVDKFQLIEKDIDYGYAITAHKSQGSTYHTVYIDEDDFNKIGNRWNAKFDAEENGIKEKNQLKYVAYTRPTNVAVILY